MNLLFVVGVARMWFLNLGFPRFGLSLFDRIVSGPGILSALATVGRVGLHCAGLEERLLGRCLPLLLHTGDGRGGPFRLVPELTAVIAMDKVFGRYRQRHLHARAFVLCLFLVP